MANFLQMTLYTGVVLYAPSLAIEATTGLSSKTSIIFIAVICAFYSSIGGIKAVLVTDIFQAGLMVASLVCIIVVASNEIDGGLANVWNIASDNNRTQLFE
jgi:Na+/proline symporter